MRIVWRNCLETLLPRQQAHLKFGVQVQGLGIDIILHRTESRGASGVIVYIL